MSYAANFDPKVHLGEVICSTHALKHAGLAFRFQVQCAQITPFPGMNADPEDYLAAFLIQYQSSYFAYLNRCAHLPMELDWNPGEVFDEDQKMIVCSTHYAVYEPSSGKCIQGPCPKGAMLRQLPITVRGEDIYFGSLNI
jgi:nitrite reductase/ring-hydroxylating ferredoxin subunit